LSAGFVAFKYIWYVWQKDCWFCASKIECRQFDLITGTGFGMSSVWVVQE
jgi:hypothetical protein